MGRGHTREEVVPQEALEGGSSCKGEMSAIQEQLAAAAPMLGLRAVFWAVVTFQARNERLRKTL
ncbi:hypothetical protein GCM10008938_11420 [Deinococcus roseus]|uniref:Uncharacterized protein n=1 Tax=Deinococcus roseus TaxID=392414 RepID=A0ABQ2CW76_9DEIO|nr:hypothetical protein GCM10008938_11420 [Deinococcus roseus]